MSLHELLQESMFKSFLSLSILLSLPIPCQFSVFHGSRHPSIPGSSYGWAAATLAAGVGSCWSPWMLGWIIPAFRDWNLLRADGWMCYFDFSKKNHLNSGSWNICPNSDLQMSFFLCYVGHHPSCDHPMARLPPRITSSPLEPWLEQSWSC